MDSCNWDKQIILPGLWNDIQGEHANHHHLSLQSNSPVLKRDVPKIDKGDPYKISAEKLKPRLSGLHHRYILVSKSPRTLISKTLLKGYVELGYPCDYSVSK
ncbi:hypothetical protein POM88_053881 [Heracleum sosnowskyi]|uniref:Uncharacterized protein n=1 Tax=Heracleum sosnowskyi TaxID=360622 RepID=A0AAD8GNQ2_9APIA|nr:hypothetical protein POM88_053881 [Heracleum sosnowskyi]